MHATSRPCIHALTCSLVVLGLAAISSPERSSAAETRTWTDSSGKFSIDAEFVEVANGAVRLKRADGKVMTLPLGKLSDADRVYVKEQQQLRASGFAPPSGSANPFEAGLESGGGASGGLPRSGGGRPRQQGEGFREGDLVEVREHTTWLPGTVVGFDPKWSRIFVKLTSDGRMVEAHEMSLRHYDPSAQPAGVGLGTQVIDVNMTSVRRIIPLGGASGSFTPDPANDAATDWRPRPVGLNPKSGFFEKVTGMSFAPKGGRAAIGHSGGAGVHDDQSRIEILDLKAGRVVAMPVGPRSLALAAISPSGTRLATISDAETFAHGPLQLWDISGNELKHLKSWNVVFDEHRRQIEWLGWADDEHVMTVNHNGLIKWSTEGPSAVYQISGSGMKAPSFSPGGKQFAIGTDKGFSIHDVASGELLTRIAMDRFGVDRQVAFSPSGKLLAATGSSTVEVYNAATGEKVIEAYSASANSFAKGLCFLGEEHVLVGGTDLVHLPSQMTVWTYNHQASSVNALAGHVWYVFSSPIDSQTALIPFSLPHAAVKPVSDRELVLRPGDEVAIQTEISIDMGVDSQGTPVSADEQLRQALTDAGFKVVESSNKKIVGRSVPGETKEINYRMFGAMGQVQKTSYTQRVFELELVVDGEVVWKRRRVQDAPMHLQLQENESVDQAIQRVMQVDVGFFRSTVPSRVMPMAMEEARTSTLSINGLE